MSTELVIIEKENVLTVFSSKGGLTPYIEQIRSEVESFEHDMSTGVSRKKTASLARKVASSKTYLDGLGKDLVAGWKSKAKVVDGERKQMRDELSELTVLARKPFTDWEVEQALIKAEKLKEEEAEKLAAQIESDHEIALILFADEMRKRNAAAQLAEQERIDHEEEIKRQAAEAARIEAEQKAAAEIERVEREKQQAIDREIQARADAAKAKQDVIDAQELARYEAEQAEQRRIIAKQQAERDAEIAAKRARDAEIRRQQDEADRVAKAKAAREADLDNRHAKNVAAKNAIVELGFNSDGATALVKAIAKGLIPGVTISY